MAVVFGFGALHKKQGPAPLTGCTDFPWRFRLSCAASARQRHISDAVLDCIMARSVDRLARSLPSGQRAAAVISE
jgi:hypothetical protein